MHGKWTKTLYETTGELKELFSDASKRKADKRRGIAEPEGTSDSSYRVWQGEYFNHMRREYGDDSDKGYFSI